MGDAGPISLAKQTEMQYILALLNTKYTEAVAALIAPTINFSNGVAGGIPVIIDVEAKNTVDSLSEQCITFSREDWDAYETSWDFKRNPLV